MARGCKVNLHPDKGCKGTSFALSAGILLDFAAEGMPENLNDNVESLQVTVEPQCDGVDGCGAHGECVQDDVCKCNEGYVGPRCTTVKPGISSSIFCDANTLLIGERVSCTLFPRHGLGAPLSACPEQFFFVPVDNDAILAGGPLIEVGDEQATHFPCFEPAAALEFWVQPESAWPPAPAVDSSSSSSNEKPKTFAALFSVELASYRFDGKLRLPRFAKGSSDSVLQAPKFRVVPYPDSTTTVTCAKQTLMLGEATTCYVAAKTTEVPILTLARTLEPWSDAYGRVGSLEEEPGSKLNNKKNPAKPITFMFRYTLLRTAPTGTSTVGVKLCYGEPGQNTPSPQNQCVVQHATGSTSRAMPVIKATLAHVRMDDNPGAIQKAKMHVWRRDFHFAVESLNKAIFEKKSVREAKWLRANVYVLTGAFAAAKKDLKVLSRKRKWKPARRRKGGSSDGGTDGSSGSETEAAADGAAGKGARDADDDAVGILRSSIDAAETAQNRGMTAHAMGQMHDAINQLTLALRVAKSSVFLHLLRAKAASDLKLYSYIRHDTAMVLQSNDLEHSAEHLEALQLLGEAQYYLLGQSSASLKNLRLCMRRDPGRTSGCDAAHTKIIAVLDMEEKVKFATAAGDWEAAITFLHQQLELDSTSALAKEARNNLCGHYPKVKRGVYAGRAIKDCTAAINGLDDKADLFDQGAHKLYFALAWGMAVTRQFADALDNVRRALQIGGDAAGLVKEMKALKSLIEEAIAKEEAGKDYYEILGVSKTASSKEIKAAYRKLVRIWHPDKNDGSKEAAQTFMDIVEAYEVLKDVDIRAKYDRGEDVSEAKRDGADKAWDQTFTYKKEDVRSDGTVNATYVDPETGEEGWADLKVQKGENDEAETFQPRPTLDKHCCIE